MAITGAAGIVLLVGRLLFGGIFAFMGLNHFMDPDQMAPYAESKGVPWPRAAVYVSGGMLVVGGILVVIGAYAAIGAALIAAFLLVTTPMMHDFWAVPEDQRQDQMTDFLKNAALFGAALGFVALSAQEWAYALALGVI